MAALTITAASVGLTSVDDGRFRKVKFGQAMTAGQSCYKNANGKYYLADATASGTAKVAGIVYHGAATNAFGHIIERGTLDIGATIAVGETYIQGDVGGAIHAIGDSTTGWYKTVIATGTTTSSIYINITASGIVVP